ncbi:MAG: hypothetical protein C4547_10660 [Phycisphaerales bacterium]|nr:MAG: hypothetical protein C4547_10660 [Phycisphaerales bacterium]
MENEHGLSSRGANDAAAVDARPPVTIVDVPIRVRGMSKALLTLLGWGVSILLLILAAVALRLILGPTAAAGPKLLFWAPVAAVLLFWILVPIVQQRRERARVRRFVGKRADASIQELAAGIIRKRRWLSRTSGVTEFARLMAQRRQAYTVVRYARVDELSPVNGATVTFEPRLIDETDAAFADLLATLDLNRPDRPATGPSIWRTMRRNVRLKEGRASFALTLLVLALAAWSSYRLGRVTCGTAFWLAILVLTLFRSPGAAIEWFGVPGGLAVKPKVATNVIYLRPDTSVLVLRQESRYRWYAFASNGEQVYTRPMTRVEGEALLACWVSTVEPPSHERLVQALVSNAPA